MVAATATRRSIGGIPTTSGRAASTEVDSIDLTDATNGATRWRRVPLGKHLVSISIRKGSSFSWASAVADMQWSLMPVDADHAFAVTYSPAVQFTTSVNSKRSIGVNSAGYIRVKTSTAEDGGDPNATVLMGFF